MEKDDTNYHRGDELDRLREDHALFIRNYLEFNDDLEVAKNEVSRQYDIWIRVKENRRRSWGTKDVANLYKLLELEYGVNVTKDKLIGVGLKEKQ